MNNLLFNLLSYPFENNLVKPLNIKLPTVFINCLPTRYFKEFENIDILNFYADQVHYSSNCKEIQNLNGNNYSQIFVMLPKNKIEAFYFISIIVKSLQDDGRIIVIAPNYLGGRNLQKWLSLFGFEGDSFSKQKCRIFVGGLAKTNMDIITQSYEAGSVKKIKMGDNLFFTQAGVFGWNKIDRGSQLLIENIESDLQGVGADFGCGYGYLSYEILSKHKDIKLLHVVDIDYRAIDCCKKNLNFFNVDIHYHWADLTKALPFKDKLDWIIMNPPFHEGKVESKSLGIKLIEQSYEALKENGTLYLVANKHLPYEKILSAFSNVKKLQEEGGFKVFRAVK